MSLPGNRPDFDHNASAERSREALQSAFRNQGGFAVRKLALITIALAFLTGNATAQDAKAAIATAQKALGDVKSITYSGSAKDVAFQQCGANSTAMSCQGTHDPMRPINNYVRVIDLT